MAAGKLAAVGDKRPVNSVNRGKRPCESPAGVFACFVSQRDAVRELGQVR